MASKIKTGETYSARKFRNAYDRHCLPVLVSAGCLVQVETPRGKPRRWEVVGPMPGPDAYLDARRAHYSETLTSLIDDGYSEAEAVRDELQEWYDGMPENLQQGDLASTLEESASTLDNMTCEQPEIPEGLDADTLTAEFFPSKGVSRSDRLADARSRLETAEAVLQEWLLDPKNGDEDLRGEVEEVIQTLSDGSRELEDVECPSMFG